MDLTIATIAITALTILAVVLLLMLLFNPEGTRKGPDPYRMTQKEADYAARKLRGIRNSTGRVTATELKELVDGEMVGQPDCGAKEMGHDV